MGTLFEPSDLVEVRVIRAAETRRDFAPAEAFVHGVADFASVNAEGFNIYFGANPRRERGGKASDVSLARSLFVDFDNVSLDDAIDRLHDSGLPWPPSVIVESGHGAHAYWRLSEPIHDMSVWTRAQRALIHHLGSDPAIHDAPRIMRLPGFVNHKPPIAHCVLVATNSRRHALGSLMSVAERGTPSPIDANSLLTRAVQQATQGNRNNAGFWLACQLRDGGADQVAAIGVIEQFAAQVAQLGGAHPYTTTEAQASVRAAFSAPPRVIAERDCDDPPILPIEGDTLPELPGDVLPHWAREYVHELCGAKEVAQGFGVMLALATIASACQRRYCVEVEPQYTEPLCLYIAAAMESGERKTAIHGPIVRPLFELQKTIRDAAQEQSAAAEVKRTLAERETKQLERQYDDATMTGDTAECQRIHRELTRLKLENPKPQPWPQLVVEDFTDAALGVALAASGNSLLCTSDEGGLFDNLAGRFADLPEIDLFLKAHTGSPYTINRTGRDNIFLARPLLSVAISPQPGVLARLGAKQGFSDRGLIARFLWALPGSRVGHRTLEPVPVNPQRRAAYTTALTSMAKANHQYNSNDPATLTFTRDAYSHWKAFERSLEPRLGEQGDLRTIKPWASKLAGAVARIAGVAQIAWSQTATGLIRPIEPEHVDRAIHMATCLIPHAIEAHRIILGGGRTAAGDIVRHFNREGWPRAAENHSAWWRSCRRWVGESSSAFEPVARVLIDHGYLIECESNAQPGGGRPARKLRANRRLLSSPSAPQ